MVTYRGRPVFPFEIDWSDLPVAAFGYDVRVGRVGFGRETTEPLQQHAVHTFEQTISMASACEVNRFERFVYSLQGRRFGFWLPGPLQELEIVRQHDADELDVVACGLTTYWQDQPAKHLWLSNSDTSASAGVKIVAVVDNGDGTERVRMENAMAVSPDARWSVSRLYYVRLASDATELVFDGPWRATARLSMVELPLETVAAATGDAYVYLYEFTETVVGDVAVYRFTSHDADVAHLGVTWEAQPFAHGELRQAVSGDNDSLAVSSHRFTGNPLNSYFPFPMTRELKVRVLEWRLGLSVSKVIFAGLVKTVKLDGLSMTAECETRLADSSREGPAFRVQLRCQYRLGDAKTCRVNMTARDHVGTITAMAGKQLTVAGLSGAANYWAHGYVVATSVTGQREVRTIIGSAGGTVTMAHRFSRVAVGAAVTVYPGCDLTAQTCATKFDNFSNYGGHPKMDKNLTLKAIKLKTAAGGKK